MNSVFHLVPAIALAISLIHPRRCPQKVVKYQACSLLYAEIAISWSRPHEIGENSPLRTFESRIRIVSEIELTELIKRCANMLSNKK